MFKVSIHLQNESVDTEQQGELAQLVRAIAWQMEIGKRDGLVVDINGNRIGAWSISKVKPTISKPKK